MDSKYGNPLTISSHWYLSLIYAAVVSFLLKSNVLFVAPFIATHWPSSRLLGLPYRFNCGFQYGFYGDPWWLPWDMWMIIISICLFYVALMSQDLSSSSCFYDVKNGILYHLHWRVANKIEQMFHWEFQLQFGISNLIAVCIESICLHIIYKAFFIWNYCLPKSWCRMINTSWSM